MAWMRSEEWRHCYGLLVALLVGGLSVAGCASADPPPQAIARATRAPYIAVIGRNAQALCAAFTPAAADRLARDVSRSDNCVERVAEVFARSAPFEPRSQPIATDAFRVTGVIQQGDTASALVVYGAGESGVRVMIELVRMSGAWRIASYPALRLVSGCYVRGALTENCPKNALVMLFSIGKPEPLSEQDGGVNGQRLVPVPPAVKSAGGQELRESEAGRKVVAQTGCLACHMIGELGKSGPGPNLTHVGLRLSERQIVYAIVDPAAPMPSFKYMPKKKLRDLAKFLSLLR